MNILTTIIALGVLIFFSHAFKELFVKTKIPNVLLLLLIGIIVGPISGLVTMEYFGEIGKVFTSITLIVILFESGVHLKLNEIKKSIGAASILTVVNFALTLVVVATVTKWLMGFDTLSAAFIGAIVGGTSSAVVIPIVRQLKMGEKSTSVLILESAISDVLCLVVGLALIDGMAQGEVEVATVFSKMWKAFLFAILLGLGGGFIWSGLIKLIRSIENSMITTLAFVFILYGVVELLKFNGGLAVLSFGIVLGNNELINSNKFYKKVFNFETSGFNETEQNFFSEIVFVMQTFFFVYIGIALKFSSISVYLIAFLVVLLIIFFRTGTIWLFSRKGVTKGERNIMSVLTPKGLVTAVLASVPFQSGIATGENIQNLGYAIVLFSIVICSLLVVILSINPNFFGEVIDKSKKKISENLNRKETEEASDKNETSD
jgi:potassium/hydrogen antiporter